MHGISEQQWIEYIDGLSKTKDSRRIESHLTECSQCQELKKQMTQAKSVIHAGFEKSRNTSLLTNHQVEVGLDNVLARISLLQIDNTDTCYVSIQKRLEALIEILTPMCGTRAARRVIGIAAERSPACSVEKITSDNWNPFLHNLRSIISVLCGDFGARVVTVYGSR